MAKTTNSLIKVRVRVLDHAKDLPLPQIQSAGAAGLDLVAAVLEDAPIQLKPGARALVPTGLMIELPLGTEAQIRPRSGLAVKHGITVLNTPGTVDSDYRGEVQVLLVNLGDATFTIRRGERIAQMVVASHRQVRLVPAISLTDTARGEGGFGSTGRSGRVETGRPARKKTANPAKGGSAPRKGVKRQK